MIEINILRGMRMTLVQEQKIYNIIWNSTCQADMQRSRYNIYGWPMRSPQFELYCLEFDFLFRRITPKLIEDSTGEKTKRKRDE